MRRNLRSPRHNVLALSIAAVLAVGGCHDSGGGYSPTDLQSVIPLKIGASWTYLDVIPSDIPTFPNDSIAVTSRARTSFDSAGMRYYAISGYIGEGDSSVYYESVTQTTYIRLLDGDSGHRFVAATLLKSPVERGNRWYMNNTDNTAGYAEITSTDTAITTVAGKFTGVVHVQQVMPNGDSWYILPGTGIVYETNYSTSMISRQLMRKNF